MKYKFIYITILVCLIACKGLTDEKESDNNPNKCTQYACPIHTDKTSTIPDRCPICNGFMILVSDSLKKDSLKNHK
jgi:hypothetical protein